MNAILVLILLEDFRELFPFFEKIYFKNYFCYGVEANCSFKYEILGIEGPLEKDSHFVSLEVAEISRVFKLSIIFKLFF